MDHTEACRLLGVGPKATQGQIESAFRKLALKHHPDKGGDEAFFKKLGAARDLLLGRDDRSSARSSSQAWVRASCARCGCSTVTRDASRATVCSTCESEQRKPGDWCVVCGRYKQDLSRGDLCWCCSRLFGPKCSCGREVAMKGQECRRCKPPVPPCWAEVFKKTARRIDELLGQMPGRNADEKVLKDLLRECQTVSQRARETRDTAQNILGFKEEANELSGRIAAMANFEEAIRTRLRRKRKAPALEKELQRHCKAMRLLSDPAEIEEELQRHSAALRPP